MVANKARADSTREIVLRIYRQFGTKPFQRSQFQSNISLGPIYNTGYLKRRGDSIHLTTIGEHYAKRVIHYETNDE